jgi:hypothetical protein
MASFVVRSCLLATMLSVGCSLPVDDFHAPASETGVDQPSAVDDDAGADTASREPVQQGKKPKVRDDD